MSKVFWPWCTQSNYLLIQALSRYPSRLNPLVSPRAGNHSVVQMTDPSEADAKRSVVAQLARCTGPHTYLNIRPPKLDYRGALIPQLRAMWNF